MKPTVPRAFTKHLCNLADPPSCLTLRTLWNLFLSLNSLAASKCSQLRKISNCDPWRQRDFASVTTVFSMRGGKLHSCPFPIRFITALVALSFLIIGYFQTCYFYSHCKCYNGWHTCVSFHLCICNHSHIDKWKDPSETGVMDGYMVFFPQNTEMCIYFSQFG